MAAFKRYTKPSIMDRRLNSIYSTVRYVWLWITVEMSIISRSSTEPLKRPPNERKIDVIFSEADEYLELEHELRAYMEFLKRIRDIGKVILQILCLAIYNYIYSSSRTPI